MIQVSNLNQDLVTIMRNNDVSREVAVTALRYV